MSAALEAGAKAWFDRQQALRMDAAGRRPDGKRWQWCDITESDRIAYRALARVIVDAALSVDQHTGEHICCGGIRRGHEVTTWGPMF